MALEAIAATAVLVGGIAGAIVGVREFIRYLNNSAERERQDFICEVIRRKYFMDMEAEFLSMWSSYNKYYVNRNVRANLNNANTRLFDITKCIDRWTNILLRNTVVNPVPEAFAPLLLIYVQSLAYMYHGVLNQVDPILPTDQFRTDLRESLRNLVDTLNLYRRRIAGNAGEVDLAIWNEMIGLYNRIRSPGFPLLNLVTVADDENVRDQVIAKMRTVERAVRGLMR